MYDTDYVAGNILYGMIFIHVLYVVWGRGGGSENLGIEDEEGSGVGELAENLHPPPPANF